MTARCRACDAPLTTTFADLGSSPMSNSFLAREELSSGEVFFPLRALVCTRCFLVQLEEFESPESIFTDYAYFSSYSETWLAHARRYSEEMIPRLGLGADSLVVEVASNDGYLLRWFRERNVPVLGIEPAVNVAEVARAAGIETLTEFFGVSFATRLAAEGRRADLLIANNVLAHVPDIQGFVAGLALALKPGGTVTLEFPHLTNLIAHVQFDTIYHEHFSYLSLLALDGIFSRHGLRIFDVERLPTHGGSLRVFAMHAERAPAPTARLEAARLQERDAKLDDVATYQAFGARVAQAKRQFVRFLLDAADAGKSVVGYGAPAKATTLLNACGVRGDLIAYTVDRSPHKQARFLPGSRIPIHAPEEIARTRPDYVVIFPWNLRDEIMTQMAHVRSWGGKFVTPLPAPKVWE